MMKKNTMIDLPRDIEAIIPNNSNQNTGLHLIIMEAQAGMYHDFKSILHFPKMALVQRLEALKDERLLSIINAVKSGYYDETI